MSAITERIKAACERKGWSKYKLAQVADISNGYFTQLENDDPTAQRIQQPKLATLKKLADALDVPIEWLAFGSGPEPTWPSEPGEVG